jgi:hypothetical protein
MYDHGNENRHTTLIAGLILVIVLAAVAAFATPVGAPDNQQGSNTTSGLWRMGNRGK